ncbi:hypothetical protein MMC30_004744 [Trapelia coarctata]|nr:hypothetical protein [Trapelia coarctata]
MDTPLRKQAKGRSQSTVDAKKQNPQPTRSKSAAPALMLPVVAATSGAPVVLQSGLNNLESEVSSQKLSAERIESPPPEIVMIRKVPHSKPRMLAKITVNTFSAHSPSSPAMSRPKGLERKRGIESAEETPSKRCMLPSTSTDSLTTQELHASTMHSAPSARDEGASLSNNHLPLTQRSQDPNKRWSARSWTARHYHDMADMAERAFPFHEFMRKHNKTEKEVREVFSGVIRTPQLLQAQRGVGLARGGLGEERMKEYRVMEKETTQNVRAEAGREKRDDEEEEKRQKEKPKKEALCDNCKKKKVAGGPKTIAEAREAKDAKHRELTQALKVYDKMVDNERKDREEAAKATKTSANPTRRTPKSAAPATAK